MSWARLDDRFHANRKIRAVWKSCPAAIGLYVMAITNSAQLELDGHVDDDFLEYACPKPRDRTKLAAVLVDAGLWHRNGAGWVINDYLEYNRTREYLEARRVEAREAREKKKGGAGS